MGRWYAPRHELNSLVGTMPAREQDAPAVRVCREVLTGRVDAQSRLRVGSSSRNLEIVRILAMDLAGRIGTSLNAIACRNIKQERLHVALTSTGGLLHGFSLPGVAQTVNGA